MQEYLRAWGQDAMQKHQYDSAIYIGDKLLAITSEFIDFLTGRAYDNPQMIRMMLFSLRKPTLPMAVILAH